MVNYLKISILTIIIWISALSVMAEPSSTFSHIEWNPKFKSLPCFTQSVNVGSDYADYTYSVHLDYPEYVPLKASEIDSLRKYDFVPKDSIVIDTYLGITRKTGVLEISFVPIALINNKLCRLESCKITIDKKPKSARSKRLKGTSNPRYASHSVLSEGKWAKIRVKEEGVYSLTPSFLSSLGFHDISKVKVYGYGGRVQNATIDYSQSENSDYEDLEEVPLYRRANDAIFYAEGTRRWGALTKNTSVGVYISKFQNNPYSSYSYYFITEGENPLEMQDEVPDAKSSSVKITKVPYQALIDNDEYSWYSSGRTFFESYNFANGNSRNYNLPTAKIDTSLTGVVTMVFSASCQEDRTAVQLYLNDNNLGTFSLAKLEEHDKAVLSTKTYYSKLFKDNNVFNIKTTAGHDARLDYLKVDYYRHLVFSDNAMLFRHYRDNASNFILRVPENDNVRIWRLGYPGHPTTNVPTTRTDTLLTCLVDNPSLRYLALDITSSFSTPEKVGMINNQDLHADSALDMVIIIPESGKLLKQAQRLADYHASKDSLRVKIVKADALYNEFSSGTPDAGAYRRYLKMLYDKANTEAEMPRYLLLFGGSVWDNRMITQECKYLDPKDYLLCYESEASVNEVSSYVSDDFFGLLDDGEGSNLLTEKIDLGIGRLPVTTSEEAEIIVDKMINYMDNKVCGSWKNDVYLVADDGDSYAHMYDAQSVCSTVENNFPKIALKRIYLDAHNRESSSTGNSYPAVQAKLKNILNNKGALVMNYTGHGSPYQISHEKVLTLADFKEASSVNIPLWIAASCEMSPFDMLEETIGETALLNKSSAAIGFLSASRAVYSAQNNSLNNLFMRYVFETYGDGKRYSIGDALRETKVKLVSPSTSSDPRDYSYNKLKYGLLGDPAMILTMPTYNVLIDSINGLPLSDVSNLPHLNAGDFARIKGHVEDNAGNRLTAFNGSVTLTLMDSKDTITCLNNPVDDVDTLFYYTEYSKTLYEGSDSVRNGSFETEVPIPLDIKYTDLNGRLNMYAVNKEKTIEANGVCYDFLVGGTSPSLINDNTGPSIFVYLNTPDFADGGNVNESPFFYATLNDSDGINATGNGIGHDIELIIDGKENMSYNLNNYYVNDFGSYTSGSVAYHIPALEEGRHSLLFRAWDMKNNSSSKVLKFNVVDGLSPRILKATLSKDPALTSTAFIIGYDRPGTETRYTVSVYDCFGRLWWKHTENGTSDNAGYYRINWDLTANSGVYLPSGLYLYKVSVSSDGSDESTKTEKLVIHKQ